MIQTEAQTGEQADGLPARKLALAVLGDIFDRHRTLDEAFSRHQDDYQTLPTRDRAFARLLVATTLRRLGEIDKILTDLLHQPLGELTPRASLDVLRLGVVQLVFLHTPAHAAVDTTVNLMKEAGLTHHKGLANAVMRRMTREAPPVVPPRDGGRLNTPDWMWHEWVNDYGVDTALDIAVANMDQAALDISVRSDVASWADKLQAQVLPNGTLRRAAGGLITDMPGYDAGSWWVQNLAAALPASLLGDLHEKTVIDLCAAPGGKTAQLAVAGAQVIAVDRSAKRMTRLKENMDRLGLDVETVIADAAVWQPEEKADIVLLDAPCTATGTIRHEPDVLRLKTPEDRAKLAALQARLLDAAAEMVKPGGLVLFCTCSLQKAEGENQAADFLKRKPGMQLKPFMPDEIFGFSQLLTPEGYLRAFPHHLQEIGGIDGFFIARFARS